MKFEKGTLKTLKKDGKIFIYAVTTLSSINSSGDHEESIELFELPERKEAEQKAQDVLKIIDEFAGLRLYRSKSCQLLVRRLKEQIKEEIKRNEQTK